MSFTEALARKDDAVFRRFGEDAAYRPVSGAEVSPVRIIPKRPDEIDRFGDSQIITSTCRVRVRRSEVPAPRVRDIFVIVEDGQEVLFILTADPMLNARRTVWTAEAELVQAP